MVQNEGKKGPGVLFRVRPRRNARGEFTEHDTVFHQYDDMIKFPGLSVSLSSWWYYSIRFASCMRREVSHLVHHRVTELFCKT